MVRLLDHREGRSLGNRRPSCLLRNKGEGERRGRGLEKGEVRKGGRGKGVSGDAGAGGGEVGPLEAR